MEQDELDYGDEIPKTPRSDGASEFEFGYDENIKDETTETDERISSLEAQLRELKELLERNIGERRNGTEEEENQPKNSADDKSKPSEKQRIVVTIQNDPPNLPNIAENSEEKENSNNSSKNRTQPPELVVQRIMYCRIVSIRLDNLNLVQLNNITLAPTNTYGVGISGKITLTKHYGNIVPARIDQLPQPRCTTFLTGDNLRPMDDIYIVGRALVTPEEDGACLINIHAYPACASEVQVHSIHTDIPRFFQPPILHPVEKHCAINFHDGQFPMRQPTRIHYCTSINTSVQLHIFHQELMEKTDTATASCGKSNYDFADEVDLSRAALNNAQKTNHAISFDTTPKPLLNPTDILDITKDRFDTESILLTMR
ncbi:hypothetical protein ANCDUO_05600 [Ancylostoma duodenale]|uniref:Uncharacterized protein n=1 Tax=Ancylostoma duodenale TaxID=51022 RepID=A0A0C2GYA5_9BILA|nr:hypothetical protein ANCDUO_05600 [Ancylostoma duodenale]